MADVTGTTYAGNADIGYGTEILVGQGDGSPETFVAISDVVEIGGLENFTNEIIDKTHLRSIGRAREKMVGVADYESVTVKCQYDPAAVHGAHKTAGGDGFDADHNLPALQLSGEENNFKVLIGSGATQEEFNFRGVVSGMQRSPITVNGKLERTYTVTPLSDYRL